MEPFNLEQEQKELGDNKASLAFSNMLRQHLFEQENPPVEEEAEGQTVESPEMASEAPVEPQNTAVVPDSEDLKAEIQGDMKSFKKEVQKMIKDEIGDIKQMIKELANEETTETTE